MVEPRTKYKVVFDYIVYILTLFDFACHPTGANGIRQSNGQYSSKQSPNIEAEEKSGLKAVSQHRSDDGIAKSRFLLPLPSSLAIIYKQLRV